MKKKTITLSKDTYFYLFDLCSERLNDLKKAVDHSDEDCENYGWMRQERETARNTISIARRLLDAVLFGEDDDV